MFIRILDWIGERTPPRVRASLPAHLHRLLRRHFSRLPGRLTMPEEIRITEAEYQCLRQDFRCVWSSERYDIPGRE